MGDSTPSTGQHRLSFRDWGSLSDGDVVQVCHPDWRGVRTVAYAFRSPVIECGDLETSAEDLIRNLVAKKPRCVVIQGWPPGAETFVRQLHGAGVRVKCLLHSSPVQHGAEAGEAAVVDLVLGLAAESVLDGVGMAKKGVQEAFGLLGHAVEYVPNRAPAVTPGTRLDLGPGLHVGVFAEPFWRKNVTTQLMAAALLGATGHVMKRPVNGYLSSLPIVEHGELPYDEFVALQGSVGINLYVTLSECHPSTPQESYLYGVPCLTSRTSAVFRSDRELWDLTTVSELDNPDAIAAAARRLLDHREEAVVRARAWISAADAVGAAAWVEFVGA